MEPYTDAAIAAAVSGPHAGVDEAGRGPLAGPVIAAAVMLDPRADPIAGLADSKTLGRVRRERLDVLIRERSLAFGLGRAEVWEIDALNILNATMLAMRRAVAALALRPAMVYVDGNRVPSLAVPAQAVIGADARIPAVSAASILAKVSRDREMSRIGQRYPGYGFERHKGYPTRAHLEALQRLGVTPEHRRSFAPVSRLTGRAWREAPGS